MTVAYESKSEMTTVSRVALAMSLIVVKISGPIPRCHHSSPSARHISMGVGNVLKGEFTHTSRVAPAQNATMSPEVVRSTTRLGRNAAASGDMRSVARAEHDD